MKCDLCHAEIKFRCSPEKFARAVKNGLTRVSPRFIRTRTLRKFVDEKKDAVEA